MTERVFALTVVLDRDIREDDAEGLIAAIRHMRGVLGVKAEVADKPLYAAQVRVDQEWRRRLRSIDRPFDERPSTGNGQ